jgi:hypothetical protein
MRWRVESGRGGPEWVVDAQPAIQEPEERVYAARSSGTKSLWCRSGLEVVQHIPRGRSGRDNKRHLRQRNVSFISRSDPHLRQCLPANRVSPGTVFVPANIHHAADHFSAGVEYKTLGWRVQAEWKDTKIVGPYGTMQECIVLEKYTVKGGTLAELIMRFTWFDMTVPLNLYWMGSYWNTKDVVDDILDIARRQ